MVRQAAIRESRAQVNYLNLQNLRKLKNEKNGAQHYSNFALGKCPPRQRMWGLSVTVILGVHLVREADHRL